jgi:hypothetical protein
LSGELDSMEKLFLRQPTLDQPKASHLVREEIRLKEVKAKQMGEEKRRLQLEMEAKKRTYEKEQNKLQLEVNKLDADRPKVVQELAALKRSSNYRTDEQTKVLKDQLQEINDLSAAMKVVLDSGKTTCPIGFDDMEQVFSCQTCSNSICRGCKDKLEGEPPTCPNCRQDLAARPQERPRREADQCLGGHYHRDFSWTSRDLVHVVNIFLCNFLTQ